MLLFGYVLIVASVGSLVLAADYGDDHLSEQYERWEDQQYRQRGLNDRNNDRVPYGVGVGSNPTVQGQMAMRSGGASVVMGQPAGATILTSQQYNPGMVSQQMVPVGPPIQPMAQVSSMRAGTVDTQQTVVGGQRPVLEVPVSQETMTRAPLVQQPIMQQPVLQRVVQPVVQPIVQQPIIQPIVQTVVKQPIVEQPLIQQAVVEQTQVQDQNLQRAALMQPAMSQQTMPIQVVARPMSLQGQQMQNMQLQQMQQMQAAQQMQPMMRSWSVPVQMQPMGMQPMAMQRPIFVQSRNF